MNSFVVFVYDKNYLVVFKIVLGVLRSINITFRVT